MKVLTALPTNRRAAGWCDTCHCLPVDRRRRDSCGRQRREALDGGLQGKAGPKGPATGSSLPRQLLVDEVHAVLAPEDFLADDEGRRAENAAGQACVGLGDQLLTDLGAVGERDETVGVDAQRRRDRAEAVELGDRGVVAFPVGGEDLLQIFPFLAEAAHGERAAQRRAGLDREFGRHPERQLVRRPSGEDRRCGW